MRYFGWVRWRAPHGTSGEARAFGRKVLGELMAHVERLGVRQGVMHRQMPDGTAVTARWDGTTPVIEVVPVGTTVAELPESLSTTLWIPRGFSLSPASDMAPRGWGLPARVDDLRPGIDVANWTANGAVCDVLLTRVPNAGFPDKTEDVVVPLLWHPDYAQKPEDDYALPVDRGGWAAYRLEFVDYDAQSMSMLSDAERGAVAAQKRALFKLVQEQRQSVGVLPQTLPWRGFYDSAQVKAEMMFANRVMGHFGGDFPPSFRTPDGNARDLATCPSNILSEDYGLGIGENLATTAPVITIVGTDPNGVEIARLDEPGPMITAKMAFDVWMDEPPGVRNHRWNIENAETNLAAHYVGIRGDCIAQQFAIRDKWLKTGQRAWRSVHPEIPILSWYGPSGLALTFETFHVDPVNWSGPQAPPWRPFAMQVGIEGLVEHMAPDIHIPYVQYATMPGYLPGVDGDHKRYNFDVATVFFSNSLFMRGRAIAQAPPGAAIWAAAVEKRASVYRIVILAHHEDDQPANKHIEGFARFLRVWYCDVQTSDIAVLGLSPQAVIRGVYEDREVDPEKPWEEPRAEWHWKGGTLIDIGIVDGEGDEVNSLKYNAQWVPNHAGTQFVCLRDTGTLQQWAEMQHDLFAVGVQLLEMYRSRAVVLTVNSTDAGIDPVLEWLPYADVQYPVEVESPEDLPGVVLPAGPSFLKWRMTGGLFAAGWSADDELKFCHYREVVRDNDDGLGYQYVFWGAADADMFDPDAHLHLYGSDFAGDEAYRDIDTNVMDVEDEALFSLGIRPQRRWHKVSGEDQPEFDPNWPWCWQETGAEAMFEAVLYRQGEVLHRRQHGIAQTDRVAYGQNLNYCYGFAGDLTALQTYRRQQTMYSVPMYVTDGKDWVFSYCVVPQQFAAMVVTEFSPNPCRYPAVACGHPPRDLRFVNSNECIVRSAGAVASFATEDELYQLLGIQGTRPRLINVGVL